MSSQPFLTDKTLIYLITPGELTGLNFALEAPKLLEILNYAIEAKIPLVQIREKKLPARLVYNLTVEAAKLARNSNTKILVNDRADIALAAGADGVHLTSNSLPTKIIRHVFSSDFIVGVSAHSLETAEDAKASGADFITYSPIYTSPGKGDPKGLEQLNFICEQLKDFPVIALGGINETNYRDVLNAGARGFAAIRFLNNPENLQKLSREIMKVCLTIAGLDPSGGAGIIADIKTFSAFGCFATAAVASLTFQNTTGVFGAISQSAETVRQQVEPILQDFEVAALKTGMLPTREVIEEVARLVKDNKLVNYVVDPVVRSTSGFDLIDDFALKSLIEQLFPLSIIVTPNLPEAERITGVKTENEGDIERAARKIQSLGAKNVLIKGGHFYEKENALSESKKTARDFLFEEDRLTIFEDAFYETTATHGTGCTLAAAITANLALGKSLSESVAIAKKFVNEAIRTAPHLGKGHSPINHSISVFNS